jgi:hypothetical protein
MKIKNLINNENKTKLIGLLTILIGLWLVLYFIPGIFVSLFNTLLGNLILIVSVLVIYMYNRTYGFIAGLIFIILFRFTWLISVKSQPSKEGFDINIDGTFVLDNPSEPSVSREQLEKDFLKIQSTINKNTIFDMEVMRSQASTEELEYFNKNGMWPWSQQVIDLYEEAVSNNPYIRTIPRQSTNYARTIYNESAILRVLSYQTKEADFLINGVLVKDPSGNNLEELPSGFGDFPYESGLLEKKTYDVIKCNLSDDNNPELERIHYTGKGAVYGEQTQTVTPVDYNDLEKIIPGFTFLSQPCNPCGSLAAKADYSCPYRLKVKNKPPFVSKIWQYLWGINDNPLETTK